MRFIKVHPIIKRLLPKYVWDIPNTDKKIYLTFDDGPTPEITQWTLGLLKKYNAKATFFCIGDNIKKYPEIFKEILADKHSVGNHTFNHLNGWKTPTTTYLENFLKCDNSILDVLPNYNSKLFRPPYGKIKTSQARAIRSLGYKIIMWTLVSYDFDSSWTTEKCLKNIIKNCKPGTIIVFHDSKKAFANLEYVLPRTLEFLKQNNYKMESIL
ncbi:MAG: peptidoglycan/xylan/chitin deacetylase (PgdA/CDA1 family) [Flavobacterium sp.]|jgi:peptidoglycan/xylan/chitin deacetylase (PgdA/CDA1 family)